MPKTKHLIAHVALALSAFALVCGTAPPARAEWNTVSPPPGLAGGGTAETVVDYTETGESPTVRVARSYAEAEATLQDRSLRQRADNASKKCSRDRSSVACHEASRVFLDQYKQVVTVARRLFETVLDAAGDAGESNGQRERLRRAFEEKRAVLNTMRTQARHRKKWATFAALVDGSQVASDPELDKLLAEVDQSLEGFDAAPGSQLDQLERYRQRARVRLLQLDLLDLKIDIAHETNLYIVVEDYIRKMTPDGSPLPPVRSLSGTPSADSSSARVPVAQSKPNVEDIWAE